MIHPWRFITAGSPEVMMGLGSDEFSSSRGRYFQVQNVNLSGCIIESVYPRTSSPPFWLGYIRLHSGQFIRNPSAEGHLGGGFPYFSPPIWGWPTGGNLVEKNGHCLHELRIDRILRIARFQLGPHGSMKKRHENSTLKTLEKTGCLHSWSLTVRSWKMTKTQKEIHLPSIICQGRAVTLRGSNT